MATSDFALLTVENTGGALALRRRSTAEVMPEAASPIYGSEAGNAAAFSDAAGERVLRAVVNIEPVQAGSGDPSPDNVRAISGFTAAKVTQCGKNLFDLSAAQGGYIDANGVPHRTQDAIANWTISDYMPVNPGTVMYVLPQTAANAARHAFYDAGLSCVGVATVNNSALTVPAEARWVRCSVRKANEETFTFSAFPDAVAGYDAQVFDISFPSEAGTVYGGVLDLTAGTLTVTHGFKQFSGADVIDYGSTTLGVFYVRLVPVAGISSSGTVHSDRYMAYRSTAGRKSGDIVVQTTGQVYIYDDRFTSRAAAEQILDTETPVIVYPLANPVEYALTPVQIAALAGANTVFADCGAVEIEYVRDTGMVIEAGDADTRAMIGEASGTTASRSLAVGEYVTVGDALYRVTRAVGSGETLVPGTNVTETTVGAELARIAAMIS